MPPPKTLEPNMPCPCGNPMSYAQCCAPLLERQQPAATAEALMRSRYTAHCVLDIDYLWDTWSPEQRIGSSKEEIGAWAESCEWLSLKILQVQAGSALDQEGLVSFIALYRQNGSLQQHREVSLFKKILLQWRYIGHA